MCFNELTVGPAVLSCITLGIFCLWLIIRKMITRVSNRSMRDLLKPGVQRQPILSLSGIVERSHVLQDDQMGLRQRKIGPQHENSLGRTFSHFSEAERGPASRQVRFDFEKEYVRLLQRYRIKQQKFMTTLEQLQKSLTQKDAFIIQLQFDLAASNSPPLPSSGDLLNYDRCRMAAPVNKCASRTYSLLRASDPVESDKSLDCLNTTDHEVLSFDECSLDQMKESLFKKRPVMVEESLSEEIYQIQALRLAVKEAERIYRELELRMEAETVKSRQLSMELENVKNKLSCNESTIDSRAQESIIGDLVSKINEMELKQSLIQGKYRQAELLEAEIIKEREKYNSQKLMLLQKINQLEREIDQSTKPTVGLEAETQCSSCDEQIWNLKCELRTQREQLVELKQRNTNLQNQKAVYQTTKTDILNSLNQQTIRNLTEQGRKYEAAISDLRHYSNRLEEKILQTEQMLTDANRQLIHKEILHLDLLSYSKEERQSLEAQVAILKESQFKLQEQITRIYQKLQNLEANLPQQAQTEPDQRETDYHSNGIVQYLSDQIEFFIEFYERLIEGPPLEVQGVPCEVLSKLEHSRQKVLDRIREYFQGQVPATGNLRRSRSAGKETHEI